MSKPDRINAVWWRRWFVDKAFLWNLAGKMGWSKFAWRASRFLATERVHMALAAYCAGIMIEARLAGQYENKPDVSLAPYKESSDA